MTSNRRPVAALVGMLALVAVAGPIGAWNVERDSIDARAAAELVRGTHAAATRNDFTGDATVTWTSSGGVRRSHVTVSDQGGAIEITTKDGAAVIDTDRRTYLRKALGWTGVVVEPTARSVPAPTHHWELGTEPAQQVAGRPTTVVVASRADGSPALRLSIDDETGLLLARDVLDPKGHVERAVRFDRIDIAPSAATVAAPSGVHDRTAAAISSIPDGYRAPQAPDGYELVAKSRHQNGVMFFYSDGLFTASVFEQRGQLDRGALTGGSDVQRGRTVIRVTREPSGDAAVWDRDGLVYTFVSDAPRDVFNGMLDTLAADERSAPESVVDYVLGPFGWG